MVLAVAVALEHAVIGQRTVLLAFGILLGGLTLAPTIALGLALQDPVERWLAEQAAARSVSGARSLSANDASGRNHPQRPRPPRKYLDALAWSG